MKIGMVPRLEYGGTPHCHRHSYGQRLADAKIDPLTIKACLHHNSLESQQAYTAPQLSKIVAELAAGNEKLELSTQLSLPELKDFYL
jgi:integrase